MNDFNDKLDKKAQWEIPITMSLKASKILYDYIAISEEGFLYVAGSAWEDCRAYIIATALEEVEKSAMFLIQFQEKCEESETFLNKDRYDRLIIIQTLEELYARERRLLEVLVSLILFNTTNEQSYYRDMILLEEFDDFLTTNLDLKEFYGAESANIAASIDRIKRDIGENEKNIDISNAWYRKSQVRLADYTGIRSGNILSSFRSRLRKALTHMNEHEKILFGFSYSGYVHASESIHFQFNPRNYLPLEGKDQSMTYKLGLLNFAILRRCHHLLGSPELAIIKQISETSPSTEVKRWAQKISKGNINVGDFVLANGDLAEVIEISESSYGYRSYKVRFLDEKPMPEISEDWYAAFYIQLLYTKPMFLEKLGQMAKAGNIPKEISDHIENLNKEELQKLIRESLGGTWKMGLRDWVKKRNEKSENNIK